jgi:hypothetical protein
MLKHYDFYVQCAEAGILPYDGLCNCAFAALIDKELIELFYPTQEDQDELYDQGLDDVFWGNEMPWEVDIDVRATAFTPLRQNIVLFMACMAGEKF